MIITGASCSKLTTAVVNEMLNFKHIINKSVAINFYRMSSVLRSGYFPKNPQNLDPSYKMVLDLLDSLGRVKLV